MTEVNLLGRNSGIRKVKPRWFVLTEGKCTEKDHIERLKRRNTGYNVIFVSIDGGTANKKLLTECSRKLRYRAFERKTDRAYIVLDQDARDDQNLINLQSSIHKRGWLPIITKPCFEYWLLLHFQDNRHITTCDETIQILTDYWPNYCKSGADHSILDGKRSSAIIRSQASYNEVSGESGMIIDIPIRRPFSMMHILIEEMMNTISIE